jgi:HEAT repeat protein
METFISTLLAYFIGMAANLSTDDILKRRGKKIERRLKRERTLRKALASIRSLRDEVSTACAELTRNRTRLGVTPHEEPLWQLLKDDVFQNDFTEWLMAGGIAEGSAVKDRLLQAMEAALTGSGANPEQIDFLKTGLFETLEKTVFAHPVLAHWRHQLSLDYLREQVAMLRRRAEEAAGVYSTQKQKAALDQYCEKTLATWDIIDLSNLPEGDIHMATQKLLLRQLYMPLRVTVEPTGHAEGDDAALAKLEQRRETRRQWEAGHLSPSQPDEPSLPDSRSPVGDRLQMSRRLVILGDPGSGKTTMLRWMATAYLLRYTGDSAFNQIPDAQTLPDRHWIPVLIRCRDLGDADLCRCFADFLTQHLHKSELLPEEADVMRAVILDCIARGEALLLVDGLDEITNPHVRMMFCQELERTVARYPDASIVVTSRIVGYRDMPYRMGSSFEHGIIAELNRDDKDLFAKRWVDVTEQQQPAAERAKRALELLDALHSSDRIQRLTGNPMLLTTLALVKRKVGKLPNRRNKLYAEAVSVLLNWNPRLYQTIEEDEAIPQLEYLAYEMCRRGVQRLTGDEVLDLLDKLRIEYPNIRTLRRREPVAFLELLEARSSILVKSGSIWRKNTTLERPVWEFRHLTFQEYLAARALLDGRFPGRDKTVSLADQVAQLAGSITMSQHYPGPEPEAEVSESWREVLRLLVADCRDDDLDDVLLAILNPLESEDATETSRPRAVLAALCLADEPNISEETAMRVLAAFAANIGGGDGVSGSVVSTLDAAAMDVATSMWAESLKRCLVEEYRRRSQNLRSNPGGLWGLVEAASWPKSVPDPLTHFARVVERLRSKDRVEQLSAALVTMHLAFEGRAALAPGLIESLFALLERDLPERYAAAWALLWLSGGWEAGREKPVWVPSDADSQVLVQALLQTPSEESELKVALISTLVKVPNPESVTAVVSVLNDPDADVRHYAVEALGRLGDSGAVEPLLASLSNSNGVVQGVVVEALGRLGDTRAVEPLLRCLDDPNPNVRRDVVKALGKLNDSRAVDPLTRMIEDRDNRVCAAATGALLALGQESGRCALANFLDHSSVERRMAAVEELASKRDRTVETLLSRDLDAGGPWIDPKDVITEARIIDAAKKLNITTQEARSLYEKLAAEFHLKLAWDSSSSH